LCTQLPLKTLLCEAGNRHIRLILLNIFLTAFGTINKKRMSNKESRLVVRLTEKEIESFHLQAKQKGFPTTSNYVRYLFKNDKTDIEQRNISKKYKEILNFNLSKIGTNLNQVAKSLNNKMFIEFDSKKLEYVISELQIFLTELKK